MKKRLVVCFSKRRYILCWFKSVTSSFDLRNNNNNYSNNNNNNNNNNNFINMSFVVVYKKIIGDTYLGELRISHDVQTSERLPSLLCWKLKGIHFFAGESCICTEGNPLFAGESKGNPPISLNFQHSRLLSTPQGVYILLTFVFKIFLHSLRNFPGYSRWSKASV